MVWGTAGRRHLLLLVCALALACLAAPAWGAFPYGGTGPEFKVGPGEVPNDLAGDDNEFKYAATPEAGSPYTSDPKELFGVRVEAVRTMNRQGKKTRFRNVEGERPTWKRALVSLHEEDRIEFF